MITIQQKKQIKEYFSGQPVDAVYLFGSQTNHKANKLSDIDFAVLFQPEINRSDRFDLRLEYMSKLGTITKFLDQTDVIDLKLAPLPLKFSAIYSKSVMFVGNEDRMKDLEIYTIKRYLDIQPSLYSIAKRQLQLLAEKGFKKND